jgi:hypothetical protein
MHGPPRFIYSIWSRRLSGNDLWSLLNEQYRTYSGCLDTKPDPTEQLWSKHETWTARLKFSDGINGTRNSESGGTRRWVCFVTRSANKGVKFSLPKHRYHMILPPSQVYKHPQRLRWDSRFSRPQSSAVRSSRDCGVSTGRKQNEGELSLFFAIVPLLLPRRMYGKATLWPGGMENTREIK